MADIPTKNLQESDDHYRYNRSLDCSPPDIISRSDELYLLAISRSYEWKLCIPQGVMFCDLSPAELRFYINGDRIVVYDKNTNASSTTILTERGNVKFSKESVSSSYFTDLNNYSRKMYIISSPSDCPHYHEVPDKLDWELPTVQNILASEFGNLNNLEDKEIAFEQPPVLKWKNATYFRWEPDPEDGFSYLHLSPKDLLIRYEQIGAKNYLGNSVSMVDIINLFSTKLDPETFPAYCTYVQTWSNELEEFRGIVAKKFSSDIC